MEQQKDNRGGARENAGRKKVIDGSIRQITTTDEEFEEIKKLLKEIRTKK